jgi:flagellar protein FliS
MVDKKPNNIEKIHKNIMKAQDIIVELMSSLNMEIEFSQKLFSIYMYINKRLIDANMKKTDEPLIEVKQYLVELRDAWEKAAKQVDNKILDSSKTHGGVNIAT